MFNKFLLVVAFSCIINATSVYALEGEKAYDGGPLQISAFAPYQLIPDDFNVYGLRLACYGHNFSVYGCDFGAWNRYHANLYGFGLAGLVSGKQGSMYGVNIAGVINYTKSDEVGWSLAGVINDVDGTLAGLQSTICYNEAENVKGVQLAIVNNCEKLNGVQLGIVNICKDQWLPFTIILNVWFSSSDEEEEKEE